MPPTGGLLVTTIFLGRVCLELAQAVALVALALHLAGSNKPAEGTTVRATANIFFGEGPRASRPHSYAQRWGARLSSATARPATCRTRLSQGCGAPAQQAISASDCAPLLGRAPLKNWYSHIDASLSRQPLVKGERLVRNEMNAVMQMRRRQQQFVYGDCHRPLADHCNIPRRLAMERVAARGAEAKRRTVRRAFCCAVRYTTRARRTAAPGTAGQQSRPRCEATPGQHSRKPAVSVASDSLRRRSLARPLSQGGQAIFCAPCPFA